MKKYLALLILIITLVSCSQQNFPIGTSESEFVRKFRAAKLERSSISGSVYRYDYYSWGGGRYDTRFYYFKNGVLVEINGGVPSPNIRIDNYNH